MDKNIEDIIEMMNGGSACVFATGIDSGFTKFPLYVDGDANVLVPAVGFAIQEFCAMISRRDANKGRAAVEYLRLVLDSIDDEGAKKGFDA